MQPLPRVVGAGRHTGVGQWLPIEAIHTCSQTALPNTSRIVQKRFPNILAAFSSGALSTLRKATATLAGVRPRAGAVPTGTVNRACGPAGCPAKHDAAKPLMAILQLPPAFAAANVTRSRQDGVALAAGDVTASGLEVTIPPAKLPRGGASISLTATIILEAGGTEGHTAPAVPINAAPYCPTGKSCLSLSAKTGQFPSAEFVATASGFVDDDDDDASRLKYEWGTFDHARGTRTTLMVDQVTLFKFAGLPAGETEVYVRVSDPLGAVVERRETVNVTAPSTGERRTCMYMFRVWQ